MGNAIVSAVVPLTPPSTRDWAAPPSPDGPSLEHDHACWMCPGFNVRKFNQNGKPGALLNRAHSGFKCANCGRHGHCRGSILDDTCVSCRTGNFIHKPMRDRD